LGNQLTPEILKDVYADITSFKISDQLNADHSLFAEVALFLKVREPIKAALNGATYGEGVRDPAQALQEGTAAGTRSPLAGMIDKTNQHGSGQGAGRLDLEAHWGQEEVDAPKRDPKSTHVAGRTRY